MGIGELVNASRADRAARAIQEIKAMRFARGLATVEKGRNLEQEIRKVLRIETQRFKVGGSERIYDGLNVVTRTAYEMNSGKYVYQSSFIRSQLARCNIIGIIYGRRSMLDFFLEHQNIHTVVEVTYEKWDKTGLMDLPGVAEWIHLDRILQSLSLITSPTRKVR